jgi:hypothetical protein
MELTPYLEGIQRDLAAAAAPGGPDIARAAELIGGSLDAAARLCLLEALSDAAAEITNRLEQGSVEVRLRGREAQFVVTQASPVEPAEPPSPVAAAQPTGDTTSASLRADQDAGAGEITRITLRLPEHLKDAVERAAAAESISVNAWLVRAISHVVSASGSPGPSVPPMPPMPGRGRLGRRVTGYAQA